MKRLLKVALHNFFRVQESVVSLLNADIDRKAIHIHKAILSIGQVSLLKFYLFYIFVLIACSFFWWTYFEHLLYVRHWNYKGDSLPFGSSESCERQTRKMDNCRALWSLQLSWDDRGGTHLSQPRALGSEKLFEEMITEPGFKGWVELNWREKREWQVTGREYSVKQT